jgi:hypothetical protein
LSEYQNDQRKDAILISGFFVFGEFLSLHSGIPLATNHAKFRRDFGELLDPAVTVW